MALYYCLPLPPPHIFRPSYVPVLRPEKTKLLTPEINLQTVNFPFSRALPSFLPSFAFLGPVEIGGQGESREQGKPGSQGEVRPYCPKLKMNSKKPRK